MTRQLRSSSHAATRRAGAWLKQARVRLPVRIKLAIVSAALTFLILCLFALVVGAFAAGRLRAGFDDELRATAADLQEQLRVERALDGSLEVRAQDLSVIRAAASGGAVIRVLDYHQRVIAPAAAPALGPAREGIVDVGPYRVVSRPLLGTQRVRSEPFGLLETPFASPAGYVQYARPRASVERTIARINLFLALGVIGGTGLAFLGGFLVASRAMRPIARLTGAAREVARTRDPRVGLPKPEARDEVHELAVTLEAMLRELAAARAEVEATLAMQRRFLADASHELRTPLTSVLANLELLEPELSGEEREIARSALRSAERMRRLVADLLALARADAAKEGRNGSRAQRTRVEMGELVREAVAELAPLAEHHELTVDLREPVFVVAERDELLRAITNLVENALVHTPPGTHVRVAVGSEHGTALLVVEDDGPGIPRAAAARVFERFTRGTTQSPGNGLGLAIVRAVAEGHGGSVVLVHRPDPGTRFELRLPACAEQKAAHAPAAAEAQAGR